MAKGKSAQAVMAVVGQMSEPETGGHRQPGGRAAGVRATPHSHQFGQLRAQCFPPATVRAHGHCSVPTPPRMTHDRSRADTVTAPLPERPPVPQLALRPPSSPWRPRSARLGLPRHKPMSVRRTLSLVAWRAAQRRGFGNVFSA